MPETAVNAETAQRDFEWVLRKAVEKRNNCSNNLIFFKEKRRALYLKIPIKNHGELYADQLNYASFYLEVATLALIQDR